MVHSPGKSSDIASHESIGVKLDVMVTVGLQV